MSSAQPEINQLIETMGLAFEQINGSYDSEFFANMLASNNEQFPPDYQMFETPDIDIERRRLLGGLPRTREEKVRFYYNNMNLKRV